MFGRRKARERHRQGSDVGRGAPGRGTWELLESGRYERVDRVLNLSELEQVLRADRARRRAEHRPVDRGASTAASLLRPRPLR